MYERLEVDGMTYVVNGLGGHPWRYDIHSCEPEHGSKVCVCVSVRMKKGGRSGWRSGGVPIFMRMIMMHTPTPN